MNRGFARAGRQGLTVCLTSLSLLSAVPSRTSSEAYIHFQVELAKDVKNFDNQDMPLIQTLFSIARTYHLPFGIELVTSDGLQKPISVRLDNGTIEQLLDVCVNQVPGYSWVFREGVVNIYGEDEFKDSSNRFNLTIPHFDVRGETLISADIKLRFAVMGQNPKSEEDSRVPGGIIGSYLGNPDPDMRPIPVEMHNATVREILNRLIAGFEGEVIWISRLPPDRLSELPSAGLWQLIGPETNDPRTLLDLDNR